MKKHECTSCKAKDCKACEKLISPKPGPPTVVPIVTSVTPDPTEHRVVRPNAFSHLSRRKSG